MFHADLAVSATGTTIYELLALGTPTVGLPQADNQEPIADALAEREAIVVPDGKTRLSDAIRDLAADADRRRTLRERGRALVDGEGVHRVYDAVVRGSS
ncbi:MAG: glycosyltransferase [Haloplanus sp.]